MSNPFERHGITHLSPSSLNCYAEQPAFWALKYLHGFREDFIPAAERGKAVEDGLAHWLFDTKRDFETALTVAQNYFESKALGLADDQTNKERDAIEPMLEQACIALNEIEMPFAKQVPLKHAFPGIEVDTIGFGDFVWPEFGLELKTTHRMPSQGRISDSHARQGSFYSTCKAMPWRFLYVSTKKFEFIDLEDTKLHMTRLEWTAHAVRRVLAVFPDKFEASRIFVPDFDNFYWKPAAIEAASHIWR